MKGANVNLNVNSYFYYKQVSQCACTKIVKASGTRIQLELELQTVNWNYKRPIWTENARLELYGFDWNNTVYHCLACDYTQSMGTYNISMNRHNFD